MEERNNEGNLLLQSFEHYLEGHCLPFNFYTLRHSSELNVAEAKARIQEEDDYQQKVIDSIFSVKDGKEQARKDFLGTLNSQTLAIQTKTDVIPGVPLHRLAEICDTIFALASSRPAYGNDDKALRVSLNSYETPMVNAFLSVAFQTKNLEEISPDHIVACIEISHYLQCSSILNGLVDILAQSVDTENCMFLCEFADRFELHTLFEKSLAHMIQSLGNLEESSAWEDFTPDLKKYILTMKSAFQSSIHSQRSSLFFSSLDEYLAIFAENIEYHRERLIAAKRGLENASQGRAYDYAADKIAKQEERVRTMEAVMKDQRKLFTMTDRVERHRIRTSGSVIG